jgi:hypothetical protein
MQSTSRDEETFVIVLHMLWECRNALIDLSQLERAKYVENCINFIINFEKGGRKKNYKRKTIEKIFRHEVAA